MLLMRLVNVAESANSGFTVAEALKQKHIKISANLFCAMPCSDLLLQNF